MRQKPFCLASTAGKLIKNKIILGGKLPSFNHDNL